MHSSSFSSNVFSLFHFYCLYCCCFLSIHDIEDALIGYLDKHTGIKVMGEEESSSNLQIKYQRGWYILPTRRLSIIFRPLISLIRIKISILYDVIHYTTHKQISISFNRHKSSCIPFLIQIHSLI